MAKRVDVESMIGKTYGKLTVIKDLYYKGNKNTEVLCRCLCGKTTIVQATHLLKSNLQSCGCHKSFVTGAKNSKHGCAKRKKTSKEYSTWIDMRKRCSDQNNTTYGAKGITVCDEWAGEFSNFLRDMGPCPGKSYSIERLDNDLGYFKENCIWADRSTQSAHRTRQRNNLSGGIGVFWSARESRWVMRVCWKGKRKEKKFTSKSEAFFYRDAFIMYNNLPHTLNLNDEGKEKLSNLFSKCGGDWNVIEAMIKSIFFDCDVTVYILPEKK